MSEKLDTAGIWGAAEVAKYLDFSEDFVRLLILPRIDFPKAVQLPTLGRKKTRRWLGRDVRHWHESAPNRLAIYHPRPKPEPIAPAPIPAPLVPPPVIRARKVGDPMSAFLRRAMRQAKKRAIKNQRDIDIDSNTVFEMLKAQNGQCAVSGLAFDLDRNGSSSKGYVKGNVRLVCHCVNLMMNEWGDSVFHELIRRVKAS